MKRRNLPITHADIERALRKFLRQGGLIRVLPEQSLPPTRPIHDGFTLQKSPRGLLLPGN